MKILLKDLTVIPVDSTAKKIEEMEELTGRRFSSLDIGSETEEIYQVLVVPKESVNLGEQMDFFGIECMVPYQNFREKVKTPEKPYILKFKLSGETNISPNEARTDLEKNSQGLTVEEGLAIAHQKPGLLEERSIDLIGSLYKTECTPTIYSWEEKKKLSAICSDVADPMCGPAYALERKEVE